MAVKLLCNATVCHLWGASKNVFLVRRQVGVNVLWEGARSLHVKLYDKDAGLDAKREANKLKHEQLMGSEELYQLEDQLKPKIRMNPHARELEHLEVPVKSQVGGEQLNELDDSDVFGNARLDEVEEDEGDIAEEEYISRPTRHSKRLDTKLYARLIKEHLNANRLKEAIDVLEQRMLVEDRVKPENYIYNLLISGCARAGYARKAFQLYAKVRQRGLKVKESTYTSLFNACANAPTRTEGLTRANRLRERMLERGYEPNTKNYNAMIKAYGRWGDVKTAYMLADEMMERNLEVTAETFNFLLQACASDEQFGFRHCLLTWHKMLKRGIQPDYYSFNTVLRCVRDCGFGDLDTMQQALQEILDDRQSFQIPGQHGENDKIESKHLESTNQETLSGGDSLPASTGIEDVNEEDMLQVQSEAVQLELPNLLAPRPHLGSMVRLAEVQKPHERFLLLGGITGFLELMKSRHITPDIETFTTMLEVIPPTNAAEKQLLTFIRKIGLKADIDFFNILIKKRSMRFDYEGGKEVLSMIRTAGLYPDIVTYGVLALGCQTVESARELLQQMRLNGIRMNIEILGAMLRQGCAQCAFPYICEIMQISLDENVRPNHIFLRHLDNFYRRCARAIDARHPSTKTKSYKKGHANFCDKLRLYQEEHGIAGLKLDDAIKKIKQQPYEHYTEEPITGMEPLKNEKLARKQKLRKYIKKIKIQNLRNDDAAESSEIKSIE